MRLPVCGNVWLSARLAVPACFNLVGRNIGGAQHVNSWAVTVATMAAELRSLPANLHTYVHVHAPLLEACCLH